jgi:hypothetical protein
MTIKSDQSGAPDPSEKRKAISLAELARMLGGLLARHYAERIVRGNRDKGETAKVKAANHLEPLSLSR